MTELERTIKALEELLYAERNNSESLKTGHGWALRNVIAMLVVMNQNEFADAVAKGYHPPAWSGL